MNTAALVQYVLAAMISWVPLTNQLERNDDGRWVRDSQGLYVREDDDHARARYEAIAENIVDVALDYTLPPIWRGAEGDVKTALVLASIGSLEGGYHAWVANGACNKKTWIGGGCDGGHAFTIFQIHVYDFVLRGDSITQAKYLNDAQPVEIIHGHDLIDDPRLGALVAYHLVRGSMLAYGSLCAYSGESCTGKHPKADARLERAKVYLDKHPIVALDERGP